jgi:hypothetical protein
MIKEISVPCKNCNKKGLYARMSLVPRVSKVRFWKGCIKWQKVSKRLQVLCWS